jgi:hypothetical protein
MEDTFVVAIEDLVDVTEDDRCREAEGTPVIAATYATAEAYVTAEPG